MAGAVGKYVLLNTGAKMPSIGLGTYLSLHGQLNTAVDFALDIGYRHIDTAVSYKNESQIGEVLSAHLKTGKLSRKDLFLTTKIPSALLDAKDIAPCVEKSLEDLKTNYLDMVLIHHPWGRKNTGDGNLSPTDRNGNPLLQHHDLISAWRCMEALVRTGKIRAIGVSNFNQHQIRKIIDRCEIRPSNVQLECHAYLQQHILRKYCSEERIVVTGYAPLGARGRPAHNRNGDDIDLLADPVVVSIASKLKRTPGQILIRYLMQIGVVPLPKSTNPNRIKENFDSHLFDLSIEDLKRLSMLNINHRYFRFSWAKHHPEYTEGAPF